MFTRDTKPFSWCFFCSLPTTFSWTVASTGPVVSLLRQPASSVGVSTVAFELEALWASTSNSSLAGAVVPSATFQVQLPGSNTWTPLCSDVNGTCGGACTGSGCNYSYTLPSAKAASYTLQFRAMLSGASGDPTAASWSYVLCDSSHYASVEEWDGAVTCLPCPPGANCAVDDVTTVSSIVALPGWYGVHGLSCVDCGVCPRV